VVDRPDRRDRHDPTTPTSRQDGAVRPMLATHGDHVPTSEEWAHEVKWDGVRAMAYVDGGRLRLESRNGRDITPRYPELRELGLALGSTGTHPWARWQDQRIIDTPHYRRNDELLRYVVWRNNTFGFHVHVGIRGADRAVAVHDGLRAFLPHLLALSVSSPIVEGVNSGLHSARTEIFTRMFPRCGIPDAFGSWDEFERFVRFLYDTGSIFEHTQLWWSVRAHLAFPTVEVRIADAPILEGAVSAAVTSTSGASLDEVISAAEEARTASKLS
jgi:YbdK family carboxylate-amine ligase